MNFFKKKGHSQPSKNARLRWNYEDHSQKFVEWVNTLGIEKTWFGKIANFLEQRFHIRRNTLIFLFCLFMSFLILIEIDFVYTGYSEGDTAVVDIRAPRQLELIDEKDTNSKKLLAEQSVPNVFDHSPNHGDKTFNNIYDGFRQMRKLLAGQPWPKKEVEREEKIKEFLRYQSNFEEILQVDSIPSRVFEWLVENRFHAHIENVLIRAVEKTSSLKIASDVGTLKAAGDEKVVVRRQDAFGRGGEVITPLSEIHDVYTIRQNLTLEGLRGTQHLSPKDSENIIKLAQLLIRPNLTLNPQETNARRQKARDAVLPVVINVKKGQTVISEGAKFQSTHIRILEEIRKINSQRNQDFSALMMAVLMVTIILVFISYLRRFTLNKVSVSTKDFLTMGLVTLAMAGLCRVFFFLLTGALENQTGLQVPSNLFVYALPAAAGPMLIGLLITSGEVIFLYTLFSAMILSFMVDFNFGFLVVSAVSGIAGARGVHNCRKRNQIYWAGVRTGAINMITIAIITLLMNSTVGDLWKTVMWNSAAGFFSGIFSSMIAMMLVPLLESIFSYTTNVRLLELGNLDHPLLKEMIVKAPGTYHHSLVVGNMVEAAAEDIGANSLLAKVASYYHDIGKTGHAGYFIENQRSGQNPHDHLSPNMSKTILVSHVKDGVELASEHKLGKPISDIILQHHGTTVMSFFLNRAKERLAEGETEISDEDFRYPGPRPQFREAALCMLADSIEAAARSLDEPNPVRLQNICKNIINRKFMDGQLDECQLTLRDLSLIEKAFYKVLVGIHHQRIDYPKHAGGGASETPDQAQVFNLKIPDQKS